MLQIILEESGQGDSYVKLERNVMTGAIFLTDNAATRQRVVPQSYSGPGWDQLKTEEWILRLQTELGWSRKSAVLFVAAAGRDDVEEEVRNAQ